MFRVPAEEARRMRGFSIARGGLELRIIPAARAHPRAAVFIHTPLKGSVLRNALRRGILRVIERRWDRLLPRDYVFIVRKTVVRNELPRIIRTAGELLGNASETTTYV